LNGRSKVRDCGDCGIENPRVFVVQDDLWCWHISGPDTLCRLCAEKRLGRRFTPGDFKPIPANTWVFETFRARHSAGRIASPESTIHKTHYRTQCVYIE
jgi:hypothetical protein